MICQKSTTFYFVIRKHHLLNRRNCFYSGSLLHFISRQREFEWEIQVEIGGNITVRVEAISTTDKREVSDVLYIPGMKLSDYKQLCHSCSNTESTPRFVFYGHKLKKLTTIINLAFEIYKINNKLYYIYEQLNVDRNTHIFMNICKYILN